MFLVKDCVVSSVGKTKKNCIITPPDLLSRNPLVVARRARRHSKELVELSPETTYDFKIQVNFRVKVRSKSNFDVFAWCSLAPAKSIFFTRNSVKMTLKGYWRHPVSISVILTTGQGQGQVTKGHQKQNLFFGMRHMIYRYFYTKNLKIEVILQSDPMQINVRSISGHDRSNFQIDIF